MNVTWIAETSQGRMVGDYVSTSFTGDGIAHPVFVIAKAPTGSVFSERAAAARFDITALQVSSRVRAGKGPVYRGSSRPEKEPQRELARKRGQRANIGRPWGREG